jgi:GT2 family glycosyltransferase
VVVTTCVASPALLRTLAGVRRQSVAPAQVIVVDNRPARSGVAELLASEGITDVLLVRESRPGVSHARNAGLAAAAAEIVAFLDDDVVVDEGWLAALIDGFLDDDVSCVTGLVLPWELRTVAQLWLEEFGGFAKGFVRQRYDLAANRGPGPVYPYAVGLFGTGANNAFRTRMLREVGGFDTHLGPPHPSRGGEDLDAYLNVLHSGGGIVYEPGALVWHQHHEDVRSLRRQIFNYGVGLSAMLTKRWVTRPAERREMLRRAMPALTYLLRPGSAKNARKSNSYPRQLTVLEMLGVAYGPVAYLLSRWIG